MALWKLFSVASVLFLLALLNIKAASPRPAELHYNCSVPSGARFYGQTDGGKPFDQIIYERYLSNRCGGIFVEVGANDGKTFSQSAFFELYMDWRGICVEAQPDKFDLLKRNRPLCSSYNLAIGSGASKFTWVQVLDDDMLSGIEEFMSAEHKMRLVGKRLVKTPLGTTRLQELFFKGERIDYMSIDVEGAELEVLASIDWDQVQIELLVIETNYVREREQAVVGYMRQRGYDKVGDVSWNQVYKRRSP